MVASYWLISPNKTSNFVSEEPVSKSEHTNPLIWYMPLQCGQTGEPVSILFDI